ncbi:uncharacterized protein LOC127848653 [Dreissena polymorpha]|uniref:uncharacterized protein LOC127848653 n=1 Tax=Dreissena polymorpha TaxID=45954 RepID=UPI0022654757|nr:uncharacterized protein LOC127848653 [Dreissena polymorpha]
MLVEQSKNISRHPNGRRWSKDFISTCLQLFNRSPKAYELLEQSKILLLPSKSVLILYKNAIKQDAGFDDACFEWMHEEALKNGMDEEHCVGGLIFDEMTIQTDIHFENNGGLLEMTGFTDIGQEGDICNKLRNGNCDKLMGTHILQLLFLGLNGFRFPFAHFVTKGIQASELYGLFWKAIRLLYTYGFKVLYTCMDGAQCNRTFLHVCLGDNPASFISSNPCYNFPVVFIMDISHVLKKIRNNILKSGNSKGSTRLLTLPDKSEIHWQMFTDYYAWDQQNALQLHRKLTSEHFHMDNQLKMRNSLAEDLLSSEMCHCFTLYKNALGEKGKILNGVIELLQQTSKMVEIFRDKMPISNKSDKRLLKIKEVDVWFVQWENGILNDTDIAKNKKMKCLMSKQCMEDIHSCLQGFLELTDNVFALKTNIPITPAMINSDVIENVFCQQRATYNGANANPSAYQYKHSINSILLGEQKISKKANAAMNAEPATPLFNISMPSNNKKRRTTCPKKSS